MVVNQERSNLGISKDGKHGRRMAKIFLNIIIKWKKIEKLDGAWQEVSKDLIK